MRHYEIAKLAPSFENSIPNVPQINSSDLKRLADVAEVTIKKYLNTFYKDDDPDHSTFDTFYDSLVQERSEL